MKDGKPEKKKVRALIEEFDKFLTDGEDRQLYKACGIGEDEWVLLRDFFYWLYVHKKYMIIPQMSI